MIGWLFSLPLFRLQGAAEAVCRIVKACLLQGIDRVIHKPLKALNLGFLLGDGCVVTGPLSDDSPGCPVFI